MTCICFHCFEKAYIAVQSHQGKMLSAGHGCPRELGSIAIQAVCSMALEGTLLQAGHLLTAMEGLGSAHSQASDSAKFTSQHERY